MARTRPVALAALAPLAWGREKTSHLERWPMNTVACPFCNHAIANNATLAGQLVNCPRCRQNFHMPPAVPAPAPAQTASPFEGMFDETPRSRSSRRLQPVERFSIWYVFDWKFEKYLTPWVLRAYWILAVVGAAVWLIFCSVYVIDALFPEQPARKAVAEAHGARFEWPPNERVHNERSPAEPSAWQLRWRDFGRRLGFFLLEVGATVLGLLTVRIACELVIVLFNIASSARAIEKSLTDQPIERKVSA